ncbi:phosphoadenosine phosphosulfate reductase [uncultured Tateyamaria sp.]|uniref:phosphoadenosine phosphosulfate reductase n=1 Tax=uncultured Tateyamaria sp. TaxID=455651 RepID=UPI00260BC54E|nr:phosphoadenosine phosphosulfate reductase [uncultured Tateyamaria sp.]
MQDADTVFDPDLADLSKDEWMSEIEAVSEEHGSFEPLGDKHFAAHIRRGDTLLVTFETVQGIRSLASNAEPLGWTFVRQNGWSHLCIASDGDTWFRDADVIAEFDDLVDDGFFDEFESVLFYGAGPCGYAAAAFSVAAPGARVLAIQPQATLDARIAEWDTRFAEMRRTDFTARYGYAPDMLDACDAAYVIYDPVEQLDAMHATLFATAGATPLRMRKMGGALQGDLIRMRILTPLILEAAAGTLDADKFASLYRARRSYLPYLRRLMGTLDGARRTDLTYLLTRNVTSRMKAPRFQRRMDEIEAQRADSQPNGENGMAEADEG